MASTPLKGDRLSAKVDLTVYLDQECTKPYPPLPPGPNGLRESTQYPGTRKAGEEVGPFSGNASAVGYEVDDFQLKYTVATPPAFFWEKWRYIDVIKPARVWVKRDQVTGFWDNGVDAPKVPKTDNDNPPPPDNTNLILGAAVVLAAFLKFRNPRN